MNALRHLMIANRHSTLDAMKKQIDTSTLKERNGTIRRRSLCNTCPQSRLCVYFAPSSLALILLMEEDQLDSLQGTLQ